LRTLKGGQTVTLFVRAAGTAEAKITITTLAEADARSADMRTLIIVGASRTRLIGRGNRSPWVYTPRSEES
jgi:precorrin-3B C17-methyltransferase